MKCNSRKFLLWLSLFLWTTCVAGLSQAQELAVPEALSTLIGERLCKERALRLQGSTIVCSQVVAQFYQQRCFLPAWSDPNAIADLIRAIHTGEADGLPSEDYHLAAIEILSRQTGEPSSPELVAERDLIMTDAIVRLSQNLLFGKVNPRTLFPDWNLSRTDTNINLTQAVQQAIDAKQITSLIENLRPKNPYYLQLKQALADYRGIAVHGGWERIPRGPVIKKGKNDRRLPTVRRRLALTGDLEISQASNPSHEYDEETAQAIRRFQSRHGLKSNGIIDTPTLHALNVPVEQRIDEILVNLERARWGFRDPPGPSQVVVDIASFTLSHTGRAGQWTTKVVVGEPYSKTPLIDSKIDNVIFNPTWTVPVSISEAELLPKIKRNPGYLRTHHYRLVSRQPLQIVQEPGPWNALGRVKFIFPNDFDVYLHDTPERHLFEEGTRTFSHGCIRVKDALKLAILLLDSPEWDRERIARVIKSRRITTVPLKEQVPVSIVYRTVDLLPDGRLVFRPDVYQRDFAVLGALQRSYSHP
jgi:L,D-transpeptidase YcbB